MKIIIIILALFCTTICHADSYLIVENATNEIYSLSNQDDAVMPKSGYTKHIIPLDLTEIQLMDHPIYYKYIDGNFVLNIGKISDRENAKIERLGVLDEYEQIQNASMKWGLKELKKEGKTFKHYTEEDFD